MAGGGVIFWPQGKPFGAACDIVKDFSMKNRILGAFVTIPALCFAHICAAQPPVPAASSDQSAASGMDPVSDAEGEASGASGVGASGPAVKRPAGQSSAHQNVFDDTWLSVGVGVGAGASYAGSDDYVVFPALLVQGKVGKFRIQPRTAGFAVDLIDDPAASKVKFSLGPVIRLRADRASQIKDPVVKLAGKLDLAVEVGASAGLSFPKLLNPYDSLSIEVDARWDVAGAHRGMVIEPNVTYFTPLSRGMAASLSVYAQHSDDDFSDYYYSVSPAQSAASGLPAYQADGGIQSAGATLLLAADFDGNLENGGLSGLLITGYTRLFGDAKNTPYTSIRGRGGQLLGVVGIGYTF